MTLYSFIFWLFVFIVFMSNFEHIFEVAYKVWHVCQ